MKNIYYDLHIHSALSPCGDDDNTPNNIVNMAKIKGLDVIAVADHNTVKNVRACQKVAKQNDIKIIPAMELTTAEDIHVLCLFNFIEDAEEFEKLVKQRQTKIKNKVEIFGNQYIMDENDVVIGQEENLLLANTDIGVYEVASLVKCFNGIAIPAHIDKEGSGLYKTLGGIDEDMGFEYFELSKNCTQEFLDNAILPDNAKFIYDSDAHYLWDIFEGENEGGKNCILEQDLIRYPFIDKITTKY